jgi:hypothetical protein
VGLASLSAGTGRHVGLTGPNPETRTTWIHVSGEGDWEGHSSGPFSLTKETFEQCIAALRACATPPMVDYEHSSLRPLDGEATPAAGYILDLAVRDDGLWALVEFTQRAAEMVRAGEYRFCSGVFMWDAADRKTGEAIPCQLDSIGLTNKPFIDGQHAIRLSRRSLGASMEITKKDLMAKLDALVSGSSVTPQDLKAIAEFLEAQAKPEEVKVEELAKPVADAKPGEPKPGEEKPKDAALSAPVAAPLAAPPADPGAAPVSATPALDGDAAAMLLTKLTELSGLDTASLIASLEANADQIKAALLGGDGGTMPYQAMSSAQATVIADLTAKVKAYQAEEAKRADEAMVAEVDGLVACGKVLPASRVAMLSLARSSPADFRALAKDLPVVVPMGKHAPAVGPATDSNAGAVLDPDNVPVTHPRYVELAAQYQDHRNPWARLLPTEPSARAAAIDAAVRRRIRSEQPISG